MRASYVILIVVALTVALVRPLRDQARLHWTAIRWAVSPAAGTRAAKGERASGMWLDQVVSHYVFTGRAERFVARRYPHDPSMLMAAGMLADAEGSRDTTDATALVKRAAEEGGGAVAWSAHFARLKRSSQWFARLGTLGGDPGNAEEMAENERFMSESRTPRALRPDQGRAMLAALHGWENADPKNGMPVALEAWVLYGMDRDDQALARWQDAGHLPVMSNHAGEMMRAAERLVAEMGVPEPESSWPSWSRFDATAFSPLREGARMARYEGRRAQMAGRTEEAIALWNATIEIGQRLEDSAETDIAFLVGVAVEALGGGWSWAWYDDQRTGTKGGPLLGGRFMYGPQHTFYVSQVGEEADARMRDRLVIHQVRAGMLKERTGDIEAVMVEGVVQELKACRAVSTGQVVGGQVLVGLLLLGVASLWPRRKGKEKSDFTDFRTTWQLGLAIGAALIAGFVGFFVAASGTTGVPARLAVAYALPAVAALVLSIPGKPLKQGGFSRVLAAWRGHLLGLLPPTAAIGAICYLAIGIVGVSLRVRLAETARERPMAEIIREFGPAWEHPKIPADAWRAEFPRALRGK